MNEGSVFSQWAHRIAPRTITLDSGIQVVIHPVTVESLVARGTIPLTLVQDAERATAGKGKRGGEENFLLTIPIINAVVMAAAVEPRFADVADIESGVLSIDVLSLAERTLIFEEANAAATALAPFREQPGGDADTAPSGKNIRAVAK